VPSPAKSSKASEQFAGTRMTVSIGERVRPVLRLGKRLYAGEFLSMLNPHGYGGNVWSGRTLDQLKHNINQSRSAWGKSLT
jgi:hypothetical protein